MHPILEKLENAQMKGSLFEKVFMAALESAGYLNIRKQQSGSQFGFDIYAETKTQIGTSSYCYFECKNLKNSIKPQDIAPKLIWHYRKSKITLFVIATISDLSNEAFELLATSTFPFSVEIWGKEFIINLILNSQKALSILGFSTTSNLPKPENSKILSFEPTALGILDVYHSLEPPFSFNYFLGSTGVTKCYSDFKFMLNLVVHNIGTHSLNVSNLQCRTKYYEQKPRKILTQMKMKGLYDPLKFTLKPATTAGESVLITEKSLKVEGNDYEHLQIELSDDVQTGYYQIEFNALARQYDRNYQLHSPLFPIYKPSRSDDVLFIYVVHRHYDHMSDVILSLPDAIWNLLIQEANKQNQLLYLGPTMHELAAFVKNETWQIKAVPFDSRTGILAQSHRIVYDLGIPADSEMHYISLDDTKKQLKELGLNL
ncbi:restriction endonuclease [Leptospira meyeri]|uniref:restriction endonuclease n=1 Tax=Leptospira meyeri TaxID=29508 RepID=UPI000C29956F|nr:restriction endonuclease [Leptospira meyeri]PJZ79271.1 hypothetical protein CH359_19045 [Leptospira meyeri]PJZ95105.1 hypothetical protein CH358_19005 [Leptospira meyeri]